MTKLWGSGVFKGLSRCFLRVMTPVENENCFSSEVLPIHCNLTGFQLQQKPLKVSEDFVWKQVGAFWGND